MTGNCFSESTPFFLQCSRGERGDVRNRKRAGERSETETEWEEWEGRANFHNEKVIICGVRVSFSLVSVACQLPARGHCVLPAMHTNSLTKPRLRGLPLLKNVSFTFPLPSHLSNPIHSPRFPSSPTLRHRIPLLLFLFFTFLYPFPGTHMLIWTIQINDIHSWNPTKAVEHHFI